MPTIENILWFLFGGLIGGFAWVLAGCLWCITILGIPIGKQCFKMAKLALMPFGSTVEYPDMDSCRLYTSSLTFRVFAIFSWDDMKSE